MKVKKENVKYAVKEVGLLLSGAVGMGFGIANLYTDKIIPDPILRPFTSAALYLSSVIIFGWACYEEGLYKKSLSAGPKTGPV